MFTLHVLHWNGTIQEAHFNVTDQGARLAVAEFDAFKRLATVRKLSLWSEEGPQLEWTTSVRRSPDMCGKEGATDVRVVYK